MPSTTTSLPPLDLTSGFQRNESDNALAAFHRRLALRIGTPKATTATARKIAVIVYNMLKHGRPYHEQGAQNYTAQQRKRRLGHLSK